jgi:hypothetical protein
MCATRPMLSANGPDVSPVVWLRKLSLTVSVDARQIAGGHQKFINAAESALASHCLPCRRGLWVVRGSMMAVEGGEFLLSQHRPPRAHLSKPLHPSFAILSLETGRLPDQEKSLGRQDRVDASNEVLLLPPLKMVEGLANPYDMDRLVPRVDGLNKILATEVNRTGKSVQFRSGHFQRRLRDVDADVAGDARALLAPELTRWLFRTLCPKKRTAAALRTRACRGAGHRPPGAPYNFDPRPFDRSQVLSQRVLDRFPSASASLAGLPRVCSHSSHSLGASFMK